jgi:drug/metabolite transporter (DMT)-like permease
MISQGFAIGLMLLSASLMSLSSLLLKIAGSQIPPMEGRSALDNLLALARNKRWILGLLVSVTALGMNAVAVASADLSLIQPLSGFGLIVLVVGARLLLGEVISWRERIGIAVAIVGVVLVGRASGGGAEAAATVEPTLYFQPGALLWLGALVSFIALSWMVCRARGYRGAGIVFAANTALASVLGVTFSRGFFSHLGGSGGVGAVQIAFLALFLLLATAALFLQQFALQKGRAIVVVPIMNMLQVAAPIPTGLFVFHESVGAGRYAGLIVLLVGVLLLSLRGQAGGKAG